MTEDLITYTDSSANTDQFTGIQADTRRHLIQNVRSMRMMAGTPPSEPFLRLTMPCGHKLVVPTEAGVPYKDRPCTCGNPEHFFIRYTQEGGG